MPTYLEEVDIDAGPDSWPVRDAVRSAGGRTAAVAAPLPRPIAAPRYPRGPRAVPVIAADRHRAGEVEALRKRGAAAAQERQLGLGLDALDHDVHAEAPASPMIASTIAAAPRSSGDAARNERSTLRMSTGQVAEAAQRRVPGAEVVDRDPQTLSRSSAQLGFGALGLLHDRRLGQLDDIRAGARRCRRSRR